MNNTIFIFIFLIIIAISCKEEPVGQQPLDNIAPGMVTDVRVENTPGGAILKYKLPEDEDLLYVKAVYQLKDGVDSETRASLYSDTLSVVGFGDTSEREVKVIAVDRSRNESEPVTVKISPLEPNVLSIGRTLLLKQDFGGVRATWENPNQSEISVVILYEDDNNEYVPVETFYSSTVNGQGSVLGMDTLSYNWSYYVQDRWENRSEIKYDTITPLYETEFDRFQFKAIDLNGDIGAVSNWGKEKMFNGIWGTNEGYSSPGGTGIWPQSVTVDLGVVGKISRFRLFQRMQPYVFAEGNLRKFKIYGSEELDPSGSWDSWTLLMDCESIKPSGLPIGENSNEDIDLAQNGEDFFGSAANPPVRYIRILVNQTWAGGDNFQITEFKIFGDNR